MKKTLKILSLVLAVVMLVSIVPFASAKDNGTISRVNIDYHFKRGYVINYTGDTHAYEVTWQKVYDGESGQPYADGATVVAQTDESYALEINLAAKTGYTFDSELTKVYFNGVPLAYTTNYYEDENQFRLHTEEYGMQLMVTFRYLAVDTDESYSSDLDSHVRAKNGFYIKNEIVELDAIPYNELFHFNTWQIMQGNADINDLQYNAPQLQMGDSLKNYIYARYKKHQFDPIVTDPTETMLGFTKNKCEDNCGYYFLSDFKAPTGKPSGLKCVARTAAAEKLTWKKINGATGYQAQMLTAAGKNGGLVTTKSTTAVIQKLAAGHAYKARVRFYITAGDGKNYYSQWTTINSPTLPKATKLTSVASAKKAFTAKWAKTAGVTGYQLQYTTNAKFSGAKLKALKGAAKVSLKVSSLKGGAKYYVRVRTFKTIGGKNYYSTWSGAKAVKTKK